MAVNTGKALVIMDISSSQRQDTNSIGRVRLRSIGLIGKRSPGLHFPCIGKAYACTFIVMTMHTLGNRDLIGYFMLDRMSGSYFRDGGITRFA
jgi:hypothetical protein